MWSRRSAEQLVPLVLKELEIREASSSASLPAEKLQLTGSDEMEASSPEIPSGSRRRDANFQLN